MTGRTKILVFASLLFLAACKTSPSEAPKASDVTDNSKVVDDFVAKFSDSVQVSKNFDDYLSQTIGLENVMVTYERENLSINFDQPYGVQAYQLKLLYTSILVTGQTYAPLCDKIEMTVHVDSEPFVTLTADCEDVTAYQSGELTVNELYSGMVLSVPMTEPAQASLEPTKESAPPTPTAIPTPSDQVLLEGINLLGVHLRQNVLEYWQIIGVVVNDGEYTVNGVDLLMEVKNEAGEIIFSKEYWLRNEYLSPGEASAFIQYIPSDVGVPAGVQVSVVEARYDPWVVDFPALEIEAARIVPGYKHSSASVVGEVYNPHEQPVMLHHITGVAADVDGLPIVIADEGTSNLYIPPGERVPFALPFDPLNPAELDAMADAYVYLDGVFVEERDPLPIRFSEGVRHYFDADGQSHIVGMLWNEGDQTAQVQLIGTLRDDQGEVIDTAKGQAPFFYIPPKGVLPFDINTWNVDRELVQENAASFEVVVDRGREILSDEQWRLVPVPVDLLSSETSSFAHVIGKTASHDLDLSGLSSMVVIATAWAGDGQNMLGTTWSSLSPNENPDFEHHLYIPIDVQNLDPMTVSYDMIIYGLERID